MAARTERAGLSIESLSPRRREVLSLVTKGLTNNEIGCALGISPGTVRVHVTAILAHLEVSNRTEAAAACVTWEAQPSRVERMMQRPAIAVLPLVGIGRGDAAKTVAAGLTEDLASLFARWCWFPVISTHSSRCGRELGTTTREVGAALGARFVLDGGVRQVGDGVRVSLRVEDAETDTVLWADQRDIAWGALARAQDALCHEVVAAAYPVLISHATARAWRGHDDVDRTAWDLAYQAMVLREQRDCQANDAARRLFTEAVEREPGFVLAHFGMGLTSYDALLNQWEPRERALDALHQAASRCLEFAPHAAEGHFLMGRGLQSHGEWGRAVAPLEAAVGLNPSFALAHACLAQSLLVADRVAESLVRMRHAARLGPRSFQAGLATLHFMAEQYEDALASAELALRSTPRYTFARALAVASAYWLGDRTRACAHLHALRETSPAFDASSFATTFGREHDAVRRLTDALDALTRPS